MDAECDYKRDDEEEEEEDEEYIYEEDAEYDENFGDDDEDLSPTAYDGDVSPTPVATAAADAYNSPAPSTAASSAGDRLSGAGLSNSSRRGSREHIRSRGPSLGSKELTVPTDSFVIAECAEVEPVMETLVNEVATLLDVSIDMAQILLQNKRWDKEKLIEAFFNDCEKEKQTAGLCHYDPAVLQRHISILYAARERDNSGVVDAVVGDEVFSCRICCDPEVASGEAFALSCGHRFCRHCYKEYLLNQLGDGLTCILARCPEHKCNERVTSRVYHTVLGDLEARTYDKFMLRNFIEASKNMKYCPAPGCDKVALGSGITAARCQCGHPFCFKANCTSDESHDPCSCSQLSEWQLKCMNESETANWILANTRKCPKCNTRIEKNQGCNHMTCRLCKHEFCWICMGEWSEHGQNTGGFYKCNRFDPSVVNNSVSAAQKAKAELDRYLHYYQRFHAHDHSLKFASLQRTRAEDRMVEQQETQKASWIDVQFLKQAVEQLIDCRRVLKYTYVLGYFLKDSTPEKQLFEHHQEMLEKNTERLQEYTEQPLDTIDRTEVVNLTRVTEKFMASLMGSMSGGVVMMDDASMLLQLGEGANGGTSSGSSSSSATASG